LTNQDKILTVIIFSVMLFGITSLAYGTHYSGNPITSSSYEPIVTLIENGNGIDVSWVYPELVAGNESFPVQNPTVRIERDEVCLTNSVFSGYEQYLLPHDSTYLRISSYCGSTTEGNYQLGTISNGNPLEVIPKSITLKIITVNILS